MAQCIVSDQAELAWLCSFTGRLGFLVKPQIKMGQHDRLYEEVLNCLRFDIVVSV